jgi:hypothetical protein
LLECSLIIDVLTQRLLAAFDPPTAPPRFDPAQVGAITRVIRQARENELVPFANPKARWDFLEAARRYLHSLSNREEILVAFGTQGGPSRSARSRLLALWRGVGTERGVALGPELMKLLADVAGSSNDEAIVVHNHPPYWLRHVAAALGLWKPTPSPQDRDLMLRYEAVCVTAWFSRAACGRFRWYLVDEGEISEFRIPDPTTAVTVLDRLLNRSPVGAPSGAAR